MNRQVLALCCVLATPAAFAQHAGHAPAKQAEPAFVNHAAIDHSTMDHSKGDHGHPAGDAPREPIPPVTDADRQAAFPPVHAHHAHGTRLHHFTLIDRLEVADGDHGTDLGWEAGGWIGGDVQKFWWRSEGHAADSKLERGSVEGLYGRGIRAWWDVVAGVRYDTGEGPSRTWAAIGVQGFAPYKFEVSATAYLGQGGRTALVAEAEYDTLLTNRLILQWRAEAGAYGKDDPALGIGSGLSSVEAGLRLRYEITRQFAPYLGIEHAHAFGRTARFHRDAGQGAHDTKAVAGIRIWF